MQCSSLLFSSLTVWAQHIRSKPASPRGTECFWIGEGLSYLMRRIFLAMNEGRLFRSLNFSRTGIVSAPGPDRSTGVESWMTPCKTSVWFPNSWLSSRALNWGLRTLCNFRTVPLFLVTWFQKNCVSAVAFLKEASSCACRPFPPVFIWRSRL